MPFEKGQSGNLNGRGKGTPNKATREIKEAFQNLLEKNTPNMIKWMERVAAEDPAKALTLCADLAEFIIPKLGRTTHVGDDESPILVQILDNVPKK